MFVDPTALPAWLLAGLLVGVAGSLGVATLFVVTMRRFPSRVQSGPRRDGDGRRREELRAYLQAIEEPFAEDHPVAGQSVAFYLPARDVAITFDARAFYRIEATETVPVLVEHEMPGTALGARLPFAVPEVSLGAATPRDRQDPVTGAFRELGLSRPASLADVKSAYRERVKDVHPDMGGDQDSFQRVREAYTTAKQHAAEQPVADGGEVTGRDSSARF